MHLSRLGLLVHLVASLPWWHPSTSALPWHAGPASIGVDGHAHSGVGHLHRLSGIVYAVQLVDG